MSDEQKHGGPAFPTSNGGSPDDGMTLRDYFAAKAMQAAMTGATLPGLLTREPETMRAVSQMADAVYAIADAMLKARQA